MRLWIGFTCLLLTACHHKNHRVNESPKVQPVYYQQWQLAGKMSFSDGQDGGSGRLIWQEKNGFVQATFKAPLGQGSWQLNELNASITDSNGQVSSGIDMSALLAEQLGWEVPWQALKYSIKGVPIGKSESIKVNGDQNFTFEGWTIEWKNIKQVQGHWLPHKIFLKKPPFAVKVAIRTWKWPIQ